MVITLKAIDLTGKKYGRLTVLELDKSAKQQNRKWKCKCDCGNVTSVAGNNLKNGHTQSCGCIPKNSTFYFTLQKSNLSKS